jgi:hypothetical protein
VLALYPISRASVDEDSGVRGAEKVPHPAKPHIRETSSLKDQHQTVPTDRLKSLCKIKLEDNSRVLAMVTVLNQLSGINKIL